MNDKYFYLQKDEADKKALQEVDNSLLNDIDEEVGLPKIMNKKIKKEKKGKKEKKKKEKKIEKKGKKAKSKEKN